MTNDLKTGEPKNESFRDRIATVDAKGKRNWVFAHKPKGRFYNIRTIVSLGFFILFFALPFIKVNGSPFFLFNVPEAKFIIFGKTPLLIDSHKRIISFEPQAPKV